MNSINFDKVGCPKCGSLSKKCMAELTPTTHKEMYYIKCSVCGWETEKYFILMMAEMSWVDERSIQ